jgi:hypothetical protein
MPVRFSRTREFDFRFGFGYILIATPRRRLWLRSSMQSAGLPPLTRLTMKLPTFHQAFQGARTTFRRFPFVICDSVLTTGAALILVDYEGPPGPTILFKILLAGILGIPLLTVLLLAAEKKRMTRTKVLGLQIVGVLLLVGYACTVPADLARAPFVTLFQFLVLTVGLLLVVSVGPFLSKGEVNGFWQYNKSLFLRVLLALLDSMVLYAGLSVALAALENLFGLHVPGKRYFELWILISGAFTTWFILGGIPEKLSELELSSDFPKGLKVFAQYILFPIVLIYLVILYAYLAKIVIAWDWPQGWVSKLILGFSATGICLLLLLRPVMDRAETVWFKRVAQWFYIVLIPLVVMLFLAIWRRVSEYGITEGRYLAIASGIWLALLILYFTLGRTKSIKFIPISLCVFTFVASFGPWGAFSVARQSQIGRLQAIATQAGLLVNEKVRPAHAEVSFQDAKQMSAILSYLHEIHGFGGIQDWFDESLKEDTIASGVAYKSPGAVAGMMGFKYVDRWAESSSGIVTLEAENAFDLSGYQRLVHMPAYAWEKRDVKIPADSLAFQLSKDMDTLSFTSIRTGTGLLQIDLRQHVQRLMKEYALSATGRIPNPAMAVDGSGNGLSVRVCPWRIQTQQQEGKAKITRVDAVILYTRHPD